MKNSKIFTETFEVEDHEFKESFIDSKGETWSATCDAEIEFSTNHWESLSARDDEMEVNVYSSKISNLVLLNGEEEKNPTFPSNMTLYISAGLVGISWLAL